MRSSHRGAVVSEVRRPRLRRDGQHRTGSKQGAWGPSGFTVFGLVRPVRLSSTFRGEGCTGKQGREAGFRVWHHCEGFDPGSE